MATIDSLLDALRDQAASALFTARATTSRISNNAPVGVRNHNLDYTFRKPTLAPPPGFGDLLPGDTTGDTIQFLDSEAEKWLDKFFPEIQACLRTTPEEWLCGILTGQKPFGLDKAIFDLVWHNSRDREYKARNTEVRQIYNRFSNRGFTLPPGALVAATAQAEERASDAIAEVNRAQTLRDAEIKLDLMKFAEEQADEFGVVTQPAVMLATRGGYVNRAGIPGTEAGQTWASWDSGATWSKIADYGSPSGTFYSGSKFNPRQEIIIPGG